MLQIGLLTMYNEDPTILDSTYFPLPEGVDHTTLDPLLLAETAELEILYPELESFRDAYNAYAYRNLDADTLAYINSLWEEIKIN